MQDEPKDYAVTVKDIRTGSDRRKRQEDKIADVIARDAVRNVFSILGLNSDDPSAIEEFREDLRFGRKIRKAFSAGAMAFLTVIVGCLASAVWALIVGSNK